MYEFYLFSLLSSIVFLVLWQTFGGVKSLNRIFGLLFLFAIITYAISLFQLHLKDFYSLKIVFRDLIIMSFVSFASIQARKTKLGIMTWLLISGFSSYVLAQNRAVLLPKDFSLAQDGELFIKLNSNTSEELTAFLANESIEIRKAFTLANEDVTELDNYYTLDLQRNDPIYLNEIKSSLASFDMIELIEENEEIYLSPLVSDVVQKRKTDIKFNDPLVKDQWALKALNVEGLSEIVASDVVANKKAKLFILDTGVDASHEDLKANYESVNKKYDTDKQSHGTHCAGIAAAVCNNRKGVSSLALNNEMFTVTGIKVLNDSGMGTQKKIIDGIIEAAEKGADVISLSLGGRSTDKRQKLYEETVAYANQLGAIVVVAAGNSSMNAKGYSPANTPGVIAVSAINQNLNLATFSNTVEDLEMGISAPGVNILSTTPGNQYKSFNGTSMATPYVSGLAVLMKSINPDLTTREIYALMNDNGRDVQQQSKSGNLIDPLKTVKNLLGKKVFPN